MEAESDRKDHAQMQLEADHSDNSGLNKQDFVSGNFGESTKENLDLKTSQDHSQNNGHYEVTGAVSPLSRIDLVERDAETDQSDSSGFQKKAVGDAETDQSDSSGFKQKGVVNRDDQSGSEENVGAGNSQSGLLPSKQVQDTGQWIADSSKQTAIASPLHESNQCSSIYRVSTRDEFDIGNGDHPLLGNNESQTLANDHMVEDENSIGEGICLPREISSSIEKEKSANINETDPFAEENQTANGSKIDSMALCIESNVPHTTASKDTQPLPMLSSSDNGQQQRPATDELIREAEILPPSRSIEEENSGVQNEIDLFLDPSNQEWSDLDFGGDETTYISSEMEKWQRFDTEEVTTGADSIQGTDQKGLWWEHLLDDDLESAGKINEANHMQLASPPLFKENQAELELPGNPFIEEVERKSSFSEADFRKELPYMDRVSQVFEETPPLERGLTDERARCDAPLGNEASTEKEEKSAQLSTQNEQKNKLHPQSSSSLDFMEPFEAPSFMSLVDPKSHALFEASMPTYQANQPRYGHESGDVHWVANFDLEAPSTQEINRSISMPRPGSDVLDQRPGQSLSFTANREQALGNRENESPSVHRSLSGLFPPKLSPLVQKVVDKVRNTPAAANEVINSVRQVMSPKASDKKPTSGSFFTRCICW